MAEVKVIPRNNSNSFILSDASLADLYSLEITEESSPKSCSDISILLCDNFEKQCFDKDNKHKKSDDNKVRLLAKDIDAPSSPEKTAVNSNMSLCALAKNHIESNKTHTGWHLDTDFNLSDLLCNSDGFTSVKVEDLGYVNGFDTILTNQAIPKKNGLSTVQYDACDYDLSELVSESSRDLNFRPASSVSLDSLAASHVLKSSNENSKTNSDKKVTDSFMFDLRAADDSDIFQFDSFADILSEKKERSVSSSIESDSLSELSSLGSSEASKEKQEVSDETSDDDIDLSFCIKKSVKDKHSEKKSSPDSVDSGFDETDFTPELFSPDASHKSFMKTDVFGKYTTSDINGKDKLISSKQSLFSKAISARPKIDRDKRAKLKKIRCELLKNQLLPFSLNNIENQPEESDRIVDNSDSCVITSNFLTISSH